MKNLKILFSAFVLFGLFAIASCDDDKGPDAQAEQSKLLSGTWTTTSYTKPENSIYDYSNFTITFTPAENMKGGTFSTVNAGRLFVASEGLWAYADANTKTDLIIEQDQNFGASAVTITELTANSLKISVTSTNPNGRVSGLYGDYTFEFTK